MKPLLLILYWLWPCFAIAQAKEVSSLSKKDTIKPTQRQVQPYKPEILTSGFIDIVNNGQVNASARFIRLFIGEPGKFAVPLSIYSGVSSNNFQNQQTTAGIRSNEHLVNGFINPLSGLANISIDGIVFFKKQPAKITRTGLLYHGGTRILTGYKTGPITSPSTGKPINFLNSFITAGFYFQTGAWERNNAKNVGIFWLAGRYILCKTNEKQLQDITPSIQTNGLYHGWSLAWGVEINSLVNIKVIYYKYVKKPEIDFSLPIYQFSFNYSLRS
ncbi:MAG: hypothetical protein HOP10_07090 [Chitinophagaceae bacterium]|nr:hypothetical protein [Chitinophagaceae bacterium]